MDWLITGKGVHQSCILSPCLINLYEEYIMQNAGRDEAQAGLKIAGRKKKKRLPGEISINPYTQMTPSIWLK